jgi:hypothetical protein
MISRSAWHCFGPEVFRLSLRENCRPPSESHSRCRISGRAFARKTLGGTQKTDC